MMPPHATANIVRRRCETSTTTAANRIRRNFAPQLLYQGTTPQLAEKCADLKGHGFSRAE
jgi:hypothetical protein